MNSVRGKTAFVTGGAGGIGFDCCQQLLRNGAKNVAILDLPNSNGTIATKKLNEEFGAGRAFFFAADVTKLDEFEGVFKNAVGALGGLDVLINNAGILNDAHWEKEIQINFMGLVKSTLLGYEYMNKQKGGKGGVIVNVASILGLVHLPIFPVYTATKHAVLGFTGALKHHFEATGISVRVMCPGVTDTPLIKVPTSVYLEFIDKDKAQKQMLAFPKQPSENVAKTMIDLIEKGENGAVWISQTNDPPIEVQVHEYESVKLSTTLY